VNKSQLKDQLLQHIDATLDAALEAAKAAQESASHEDNQPENQYDTLSLEAAYLAHGQSERILALQNDRITLARWRPAEFDPDDEIASGAVVGLIGDQDEEQWFWLAPVGGQTVSCEGRQIQVISHQAPLARHMVGLGVDDEITIIGRVWVISNLA
jgi:transcription elongation GreA/GreB family factor